MNEITTVGVDLAKEVIVRPAKSPEFLSHRRHQNLMKPVVPSTVPYPDMRSR